MNFIRAFAMYMLEQFASETGITLDRGDEYLYRLAFNIPSELLHDLLRSQVDFFSASDGIGFLNYSDTPISKLLELTDDYPDCAFSVVLAYDNCGKLVKLWVVGLTSFHHASAEFINALTRTLPANTLISIENGAVCAHMIPDAS